MSKLGITEKKGDKNDKLITFISCKNLHYMPNVHSVFIISTENFVTMLHTPKKQNIHGSMKLQIEILLIDAELSITYYYIDSFFHFHIMNGSFVLF